MMILMLIMIWYDSNHNIDTNNNMNIIVVPSKNNNDDNNNDHNAITCYAVMPACAGRRFPLPRAPSAQAPVPSNYNNTTINQLIYRDMHVYMCIYIHTYI